MAKYYPQTPTDWTTALEKIYAKQSDQLQRHHDQLRQRDQQLVAKAGNESLANTLGSLAQFSSTISKAVQINKALTDKADARKTADLQSKFEALPLDVQERIDQIAAEDALNKEHTNLVQALKKDTTLQWSPETKDAILKLSGGKGLRLQKILASERIQGSIYLINEKLNADTEAGSKLQSDFDNHRSTGKLKGFYKTQVRELLSELGLNDKYISTHFESEIERISNTKGVLSSLKYGNVVNTQEALEFDKLHEAATFSDDPNGGAKLLQIDIQETINLAKGIDAAQAKDKVTLKLYRLAKDRKLDSKDIYNMRTGKIEGHDAGDTGEILLSEGQWLKIQSGVNEANAEIVSEKETEIKGLALTVKAELYSGNKSIPELIALKNETLKTLKSTLGEDSEEYKALESIDPTLQDVDSYAATRQEWSPFFEGSKKGQRIQNESIIKEIPNGRVRDELLDLIKKDKALRAAVGYPSTFEKNKTDVGEKIINANTTLNEESHLTGPVEHMQIEITQKRDLFLADALDRFPDDPQQAFKVADGNWEEWLTNNGFYVTADKPGAGRFSPETTGEYKNFKFWNDSSIEARSVGDEYNINKWGSNIALGLLQVARNPNLAKGTTDVDKLINMPGKVLDIRDFGALFINGELRYTPEVILKARLLKIQPSELVKKQGEALLKNGNDAHKKIAERMGLQEKLANIPTSEMDLLKEIQELGDKELLFIFNRGLEKASPKQIARLLAKLEADIEKPRKAFITSEGFSERDRSDQEN